MELELVVFYDRFGWISTSWLDITYLNDATPVTVYNSCEPSETGITTAALITAVNMETHELVKMVSGELGSNLS